MQSITETASAAAGSKILETKNFYLNVAISQLSANTSRMKQYIVNRRSALKTTVGENFFSSFTSHRQILGTRPQPSPNWTLGTCPLSYRDRRVMQCKLLTAVNFVTTIKTVKVSIADFTQWDAVASSSTLELIVAACWHILHTVKYKPCMMRYAS